MDQLEEKKRRRLKREPVYVCLCILCLIIGGASGYIYGNKTKTVQQQEYEEILEIKSILESGFVDTTDSETTLYERMIAGMVSGIGDRYTSYLTTKAAMELTSSINGSFQGIGVSFTVLKEGALALEVYQGTPANLAGVLAGDIITHVQGTSIAGYSSDKIKTTIQGEKGTDVTLRLLRNGKVLELTMQRESLDTSASYEIRDNGDNKVGYIRMTTFGEGTTSLVEKALISFKAAGVETLVIDLRGNGGGYLTAATGILDLLVDKDKRVLSVEYGDNSVHNYETSNNPKYKFTNNFILCDNDSASASEVTIAALTELEGFKTIGEKTFGKGIVQSEKTLSSQAVLKYTSAKWYTPSGKCIQGEGIDVDYEVSQTTLDQFGYSQITESYSFDQVNKDILLMQKMLIELGYQVDREDGYFSKQTENALKAFEKDYGLSTDGIYSQEDGLYLLSAITHKILVKDKDLAYEKALSLIK